MPAAATKTKKKGVATAVSAAKPKKAASVQPKKVAASVQPKKATKAKAYQLNSLSSQDIIPLTRHVQAGPDGTMLVWVHAAWCGHCVAMKDEWTQLKRAAPAAGVSLAEVEHDVASHMRQHHADNAVAQLLEGRVDGYPTILRVRWPAMGGGKPQVAPHTSGRTAKELLAFAKGV